MQLIYPGPSPAVYFPDTGIEAERGKPVEVPDEIADSLLEQGWTTPKSDKKSTGRKATNPPTEG